LCSVGEEGNAASMPAGLCRFDLDCSLISGLNLLTFQPLGIEVVREMVDRVGIIGVCLNRSAKRCRRSGMVVADGTQAVSERVELLHEIDPDERHTSFVVELTRVKQRLGGMVGSVREVGFGVLRKACVVMLE
jgi:hypothetical protein